MIGNEADPDFTKALNNDNETRKCLQRCELQTETMMTTTSTFPNRETFPYRWVFRVTTTSNWTAQCTNSVYFL